MDIVLEVFDTFVFDRAYSALVPVAGRVAIAAGNATIGSVDGFTQQLVSTWKYQPATSYFSLEPSDYAHLSSWPRNHPGRQFVSLFLITLIFGLIVYFGLASLSYVFVFDKQSLKHPLFLKDQIRMEIMQAIKAMPLMSLLTAPLFLLEVRGYSKMYDTVEDGPGMWYSLAQVPLFLFFTDMGVYWIHRGLHHPLVYKTIHKPHHKWIVPTPYASHAFHPLDGYSQSLPYHFFPFIFPLQKWVYVLLFMFVNIWTIMIHDGEYVAESKVINGAASHTLHHLYFRYNYGQYFTLWDRLGGSYRKPNPELFDRSERTSTDELTRQQKEYGQMVGEVEDGKDDRTFVTKKQQ